MARRVCRQEDIDPALLQKEKEIELQKDDLRSKPEAIALKMVEGRVAKLAKVRCTVPCPPQSPTPPPVHPRLREWTVTGTSVLASGISAPGYVQSRVAAAMQDGGRSCRPMLRPGLRCWGRTSAQT